MKQNQLNLTHTLEIEPKGKPGVIITNPPRAGIHEDVINVLLNSVPDKIVYIICNPANQARNVHFLNGNYTVEKIQLLDMFPHTQHVENVVLLKRKKVTLNKR